MRLMSAEPQNVLALDLSPVAHHFDRVGVDQPCAGGTLFKAREKSSGKVVGIQRPASDATARERFVREALAVKRLWHPHILRLYVVARDEQGPYCAIEWCDQGSLSERIGNGPLPEAEVWSIARAVASALEYAHQQGSAHGGIAASCVMLAQGSTWKLGGFGSHRLGSPPNDAESNGDASGEPGASDEARDLRAFGRMLLAAAAGPGALDASLDALPPALADMIRRTIDPRHEHAFPTIEAVVSQLRGGSIVTTMVDRNVSKPGASTAGRPWVRQPDRSKPQPETIPDTIRGRRVDPDPGAETIPMQSRGTAPPSQTPGATPNPPRPGMSSKKRPAPTRSDLPYEPMLERYEPIGQRLEGGMGYVVKCREKSTGRIVAVKRVKAIPGQDEVLIQRFHREANSIARLSHPHILTLFRAARDDEGDYIVLEWADGGSLKERLTELGHLPLHEVVEIAKKIGGALAYAHQKGVIHRDLKPHNILLMDDGTPKLADFGLARATGDQTITRTHGGAGTPVYMAPEQWISARDCDARADLCSFGKVIFHLATGQSPVKFEPEKLPLELRSTVVKLSKDRKEERYQSAEEFLAHLDRNFARARALKRYGGLFVFALVVATLVFAFREKLAPVLVPLRDKLRSLLGG